MHTTFEPVVETGAIDYADQKRTRSREATITHELRDGTLIQLDPSAPHFYLWNELANLSLSTGRPLFIQRDGELVKRVLPATRRRIVNIEDAVGGKVRLTFEVSNLSSFIDLQSEGGATLLARATSALQASKLVEFVYQPSDCRVLALREATEWHGLKEMQDAFDISPVAPVTKGLANDPLPRNLLRKAFQKCSSLTYIPYFYPNDSCAFRAWEMRRMLAGIGIACNKLFHYPKITLLPNGKVQHGRLRAETPNHPRGYILWTYHVAPLIYVSQGASGVQPYVLDPSLFDREATTEEWFARQPAENAGNNGARTFKETPGAVHYRTPQPYAPYKLPEREEHRWDLSPVEHRYDAQPVNKEVKAVKDEYKAHYASKLDLYINP